MLFFIDFFEEFFRGAKVGKRMFQEICVGTGKNKKTGIMGYVFKLGDKKISVEK